MLAKPTQREQAMWGQLGCGRITYTFRMAASGGGPLVARAESEGYGKLKLGVRRGCGGFVLSVPPGFGKPKQTKACVGGCGLGGVEGGLLTPSMPFLTYERGPVL